MPKVYFCRGLFCHCKDKKIKCYYCNTYICSCCEIKINKKHCCLDCLVLLGTKYYINDIEKALNKNNESLFNKELLKDEKKIDIKTESEKNKCNI